MTFKEIALSMIVSIIGNWLFLVAIFFGLFVDDGGNSYFGPVGRIISLVVLVMLYAAYLFGMVKIFGKGKSKEAKFWVLLIAVLGGPALGYLLILL
ncbi:MAG: hypothetical protein QY312_01710 [Candidatus Dojkabacteria bacterium]|nr:MAG: hypothetical protein QY312_01710 [Candidatus Dojkabacteria bacterium]